MTMRKFLTHLISSASFSLILSLPAYSGENGAAATPKPSGGPASVGTKTQQAPLWTMSQLAKEPFILAYVNGDIITSTDVRDRLRFVTDFSGMPLNPAVFPLFYDQVVAVMVDEKLKALEAQAAGIKIDDVTISDAVADVEKSKNLEPGELKEKMAKMAIPFETMTNQLQSSLGWAELIRKKYSPLITVTDSEVQLFQKEQDSKKPKPLYMVYEIYLMTPADGSNTATIAFARHLIKQLGQGVDFSSLAQQFSDAPTALQGGSRGWVRAGDLEDELNAALETADTDTLLGPIVTNGGVYILFVAQKQQPQKRKVTVVDATTFTLPLYFVANAEEQDQKKKDLEEELAKVTTLEELTQLATKLGAQVEHTQDKPLEVLSDDQKEALGGLKIGDLSTVKLTIDGFVVHRLNDTSEKVLIPGATTNKEIEYMLYLKKMEAAGTSYYRQVQRRAQVKYTAPAA